MPPGPVLVSGFEPFAQWTTNTSAFAAVAAGNAGAHSLILPVEYNAAAAQLIAAIGVHAPRLIVALGMAGSEDIVAIEELAHNEDNAALTDARGELRRGSPIIAGAPDRLTPIFPRQALTASLASRGWSTRPSTSAGRYVCNNLFFLVAHHLRRLAVPPPFTFVHIPSPQTWDRARAESFGRDLAFVLAAL